MKVGILALERIYACAKGCELAADVCLVGFQLGEGVRLGGADIPFKLSFQRSDASFERFVRLGQFTLLVLQRADIAAQLGIHSLKVPKRQLDAGHLLLDARDVIRLQIVDLFLKIVNVLLFCTGYKSHADARKKEEKILSPMFIRHNIYTL